ncbi:Hypothetical predicted protein [Olea europaea subsp. europaea]|uniref:NOG C-terminal domain-containing protein n=1 Tax=Olea europaea subsp. europaea TaxID=158383 RepID=A0A8S0QXA2_OLEEU|nr:Hypothetical predicted protein [Olea europaea subsp. europaea]
MAWLHDIHPFNGDLLHVLFKFAVGQISTARNLIVLHSSRLFSTSSKGRPPGIPWAVLEVKVRKAEQSEEKQKTLEKDLENQNIGAGIYSANLRKHYILAKNEWKEDIMPGILIGHKMILRWMGILKNKRHWQKSERKKSRLTQQYRMKKNTAESRPTVRRKCGRDGQFTSEGMRRQQSTLGLDPTLAINHARSKSCNCKRERSIDRRDQNGTDYLAVDVPPTK